MFKYVFSLQVSIMNELVQAYSVAEDTMMQDRAAFAIQEMTKEMELRETSRTARAKLWDKFDTDTKEVVGLAYQIYLDY
jgi:hypothetical protein